MKPSVKACLDSHFKAGPDSPDAPRKEEKKNRLTERKFLPGSCHQRANTVSLEVPKKVWYAEVPLPGAITSSSRSIPESGFFLTSGAAILPQESLKTCHLTQELLLRCPSGTQHGSLGAWLAVGRGSS